MESRIPVEILGLLRWFARDSDLVISSIARLVGRGGGCGVVGFLAEDESRNLDFEFLKPTMASYQTKFTTSRVRLGSAKGHVELCPDNKHEPWLSGRKIEAWSVSKGGRINVNFAELWSGRWESKIASTFASPDLRQRRSAAALIPIGVKWCQFLRRSVQNQSFC
jgi:hypothetical protein